MIRNPLVIINGRVQELPSGDSVPSTPSEEDMPYNKKIDFVTDSILYTGEAAVGSAEGAGVWRIKKTVIAGDSDVDITWADGTANFTKVWTNRASYTYS